MTKKTTALLIPVGIIAYALFQKAKSLRNVNFYADRVHSIDMAQGVPYMTVGILVQNTSSSKIVVKSIAGNILSGAVLIGNASQFSPYSINPNSQGIMYVQIRFALLGIVTDIFDAFQSNNFTQQILFDGYANVDNYQVPIKLSYKIGLQ
jgi:hypothetical protein